MSTDIDKRIGRNVATFRGDRSQQAIADEMRARGWRWSQATVWAVEKGERPLKLAESIDLEDVLGVRLSSFTSSEPAVQVSAAIHRASDAHAELQTATRAYIEATTALEALIEDAQEEGVELSGVYQRGGGWLDQGPVETVKRVIFDVAVEESTEALRDAWMDGYGSVEDLLRAELEEAKAAGFESVVEYRVEQARLAREAWRRKRAREDADVVGDEEA